MKLYKDFFSIAKSPEAVFRSSKHRSADGRIHVPLYSDVFSNLKDNTLCTNAMYASLKSDIENSISMFRTDEKLTVNVFVSDSPSDFNCQRAILGFRRYMKACHFGYFRENLSNFMLFLIFLIAGLVLQYLLHVVHIFADREFLRSLTDTLSGIFIWQFIGFVAFQLIGVVRTLKRMKQIENIEFSFKEWE